MSSGDSDKKSRGLGPGCETSMAVEVTAVSHACGRHHFMDTCDSKRDCARMCREKAFVGVC